jgi:hypothetical protein
VLGETLPFLPAGWMFPFSPCPFPYNVSSCVQLFSPRRAPHCTDALETQLEPLTNIASLPLCAVPAVQTSWRPRWTLLPGRSLGTSC